MEKFEIVKFYQDFLKRINDIKQVIKPDAIKKELEDIDEQMSDSSFWNNQKEATRITSISKTLKSKLEKFNKVFSKIEELGILIELDDEIGDAKARRQRKQIEEVKNQGNEIEIE